MSHRSLDTIGMFRAFVFSSQFPLLRLCLCLSVQLPAPLQGQSFCLPGDLLGLDAAAGACTGCRGSQGHGSGRGLCCHSAARPKGWGTKEQGSLQREGALWLK